MRLIGVSALMQSRSTYRLRKTLPRALGSNPSLFMQESPPKGGDFYICLTFTQQMPHANTKTGVPVRLPFWKGRRTQRICSFRGTYANRGNGMALGSSDVADRVGFPACGRAASGCSMPPACCQEPSVRIPPSLCKNPRPRAEILTYG